MSNTTELYKITALKVLGRFQLIEFSLKAYIGHAYSLIKKSVKNELYFDYGARDIEEFPLERLINIFSKLNSNKDLVFRLNQLRQVRNQIAHRSLIITFGSMYDTGEIEDKYIEYLQIENELNECLEILIAEVHSIVQTSKNKT